LVRTDWEIVRFPLAEAIFSQNSHSKNSNKAHDTTVSARTLYLTIQCFREEEQRIKGKNNQIDIALYILQVSN